MIRSRSYFSVLSYWTAGLENSFLWTGFPRATLTQQDTGCPEEQSNTTKQTKTPDIIIWFGFGGFSLLRQLLTWLCHLLSSSSEVRRDSRVWLSYPWGSFPQEGESRHLSILPCETLSSHPLNPTNLTGEQGVLPPHKNPKTKFQFPNWN